MITNPTKLTILSYFTLICIILLPQAEEKKSNYMIRLKIVIMMLLPILLSIININCMSKSCAKVANILSYLILAWCMIVVYIYIFKKLV